MTNEIVKESFEMIDLYHFIIVMSIAYLIFKLSYKGSIIDKMKGLK